MDLNTSLTDARVRAYPPYSISLTGCNLEVTLKMTYFSPCILWMGRLRSKEIKGLAQDSWWLVPDLEKTGLLALNLLHFPQLFSAPFPTPDRPACLLPGLLNRTLWGSSLNLSLSASCTGSKSVLPKPSKSGRNYRQKGWHLDISGFPHRQK